MKEGLTPSLVILLGPAPSHHSGFLTLCITKQDVIHLSSFHYTDDECNKVQTCCGLDISGLPCLEHSQVEQ